MLPFSLQRLAHLSERRNYDSSGMGVATFDDTENLEVTYLRANEMQTDETIVDGIDEVKNLPVDTFRKKINKTL